MTALSPLERKLWEMKLNIARKNHAAERARVMPGQGGASLKLLSLYARDIERAERKLAQR